MQEIEVKILEINKSQVENFLHNLGAIKTFDGVMEIFFYDFADGSIIKSGNVFRLRKENTQCILTYKKVEKNKDAKYAEEYSVEVSSLSAMQTILSCLCLKIFDKISKHRTSFEFEGTHFDIDRYLGEYQHIPEFMEIESNSIDSIRSYVKRVGFKIEDCLSWSTEQVIEHYRNKERSY